VTAIEILDPRHDPEPVDWPEFRRHHGLYPSWDYGMLATDAWLARSSAVLVLARERGRLVAAMTAMVCRPGRTFAPTRRRPGPRWVQVYQPMSTDPPFAMDVTDAALDRRAMLRAMERALRRHLGAGLLGLVYRNVTADAAVDLAGPGRLTREVDPPAALLRNRWDTTEAWLADQSRNRRKNVRKLDRALAADPTLRVTGGPGRTDLDAAELARLLRTHRARHPRGRLDPRTPTSAAYLDLLVRRPDVHTLTYTGADGRLIAFCTLVDHPHTPLLQFWASRALDGGGRPHLYFDCHARAIRYVIRHGQPGLAAGRGYFAEKRSLGFSAQRQWLVAVPGPLVGR
jgi:uncharacterized protein